MQGIYNYIPEKNYVPREHSVAAILLLLFMVLIALGLVLLLLFGIGLYADIWRIKVQLDVTCYFIALLMCSTCFGH